MLGEHTSRKNKEDWTEFLEKKKKKTILGKGKENDTPDREKDLWSVEGDKVTIFLQMEMNSECGNCLIGGGACH